MWVSEAQNVRVRIAPSPTGFAHLGTASTALYNVLFARQRHGKFALRIDDTDLERNRPEYEQLIYESLGWLELDWDEGPDKGGPYSPYRQSERADLYRQHASKLLSEGKAYKCFCTPEELEAERRLAQAQKRPYKYSRRCLTDPPKDRTEFAVRFKVPGGEIRFTDMVRGEMSFDADLIGDFILAKDGAKLSKRKHPEANLMLYREQGYLPEALINYLALLGWNPGTSQEIFTLDELVDVFSFERVQHAGARFDWEKLNWVNGEWIRAMADTELAHRLQPFLPQLDETTIMRAVPALKTRMTKLAQAVDYLDYLWTDPQPPVLDSEIKQRVQEAIDALSGTRWEPEPIEAALEKAVAESGVGKGKFYTPLRDALTGKKVSLPIHYTLALLPKEIAMDRLRKAAES